MPTLPLVLTVILTAPLPVASRTSSLPAPSPFPLPVEIRFHVLPPAGAVGEGNRLRVIAPVVVGPGLDLQPRLGRSCADADIGVSGRVIGAVDTAKHNGIALRN